MRQRGRPVLGAFSGFFLGLFVGLDLLLLGVVPLDSVVLTAAPVVGLVLGIVLARWAPIGRSRSAAPAAEPAAAPGVPSPPSPPPGWSESPASGDDAGAAATAGADGPATD